MMGGSQDYRRLRPSVTPDEVGAELARRMMPPEMEEEMADPFPNAVHEAVERARAQQTKAPPSGPYPRAT